MPLALFVEFLSYPPLVSCSHTKCVSIRNVALHCVIRGKGAENEKRGREAGEHCAQGRLL